MANPSKDKGTRFETMTARFLGDMGIRAERKALKGTSDEGDLRAVSGLWEFAVECKDRKRIELARWFSEAEAEAERCDATPLLVIHREGCGAKGFGGNLAVMRLEDFAELAADRSES